MSEDLSMTLMLALERLSPLERAAFLLHDVFGLGFDEVAATLDRDPAASASSRRGRARTCGPSGRAMPSTGRRASG